jgi:hypothetical protein
MIVNGGPAFPGKQAIFGQRDHRMCSMPIKVYNTAINVRRFCLYATSSSADKDSIVSPLKCSEVVGG